MGDTRPIWYHLSMDKPQRPRDTNQLAKHIVDIATGAAQDGPPTEKDPSAVARGRKGGRVGGLVRASRMTQEERTEAARRAVQARWQR